MGLPKPTRKLIELPHPSIRWCVIILEEKDFQESLWTKLKDKYYEHFKS